MYLMFVSLLVLLGVLAAGALAYRWLIVEQKNHTYGTIVVPRKAVARKPGMIARALGFCKNLVVSMVRPIDWSAVSLRASLVRIDEPTQTSMRR